MKVSIWLLLSIVGWHPLGAVADSCELSVASGDYMDVEGHLGRSQVSFNIGVLKFPPPVPLPYHDPLYIQNFWIIPAESFANDVLDVWKTSGDIPVEDALPEDFELLASVPIRDAVANVSIDLQLTLNHYIGYRTDSLYYGLRVGLRSHLLLVDAVGSFEAFDHFYLNPVEFVEGVVVDDGPSFSGSLLLQGMICYSFDAIPTPMPTAIPTQSPTMSPTSSPTHIPTPSPSSAPTAMPKSVDASRQGGSVDSSSFTDTDEFIVLIVVVSGVVASCGGCVFWRYKSRWLAAALAGARGFNADPSENNDDHPDMPLTEKRNREPSLDSERTEPDIEEGDEKAYLTSPTNGQRHLETEYVQREEAEAGEPSLTLSQPREHSIARESELKDPEEGKPRKIDEHMTPTERCIDVHDKAMKHEEGEGEVDDDDDTSTQLEFEDDSGEAEFTEVKDVERLPAVVASQAEISPTPREPGHENAAYANDANNRPAMGVDPKNALRTDPADANRVGSSNSVGDNEAVNTKLDKQDTPNAPEDSEPVVESKGE